MKCLKAVLFAMLVVGMLAAVGFADNDDAYSVSFTIADGYRVTRTFTLDWTGSVGSINGLPYYNPQCQGTCHATQPGYWTIEANNDYTATLTVTQFTGQVTGFKLGTTMKANFDMESDGNFEGTSGWVDNADLTYSPAGTGQDTYISQLAINYGINRNGLNDPADTYKTDLSLTVVMP